MATGRLPNHHPPQEVDEKLRLNPYPSLRLQTSRPVAYKNIFIGDVPILKSTCNFESKISLTSNGKLQLNRVSKHQGRTSIIFKESEKRKLNSRLKHVVIAKFSHGRPTSQVFHNFLCEMQFKGDYHVSLFDAKHIFIELQVFDDFTKLWLKRNCTVKGYHVRFFKWTEQFMSNRESSIVPVWIHFPGLPIYFYEEEALLSIANAVGKPLHIDRRNLDRTNLGYATVCVEMDVTSQPLNEIWIEFEEDDTENKVDGFWQKIKYGDIPSFCSGCHHLGHHVHDCKRALETIGSKGTTTPLSDDDLVQDKGQLGVLEDGEILEDIGENSCSKEITLSMELPALGVAQNNGEVLKQEHAAAGLNMTKYNATSAAEGDIVLNTTNSKAKGLKQVKGMLVIKSFTGAEPVAEGAAKSTEDTSNGSRGVTRDSSAGSREDDAGEGRSISAREASAGKLTRVSAGYQVQEVGMTAALNPGATVGAGLLLLELQGVPAQTPGAATQTARTAAGETPGAATHTAETAAGELSLLSAQTLATAAAQTEARTVEESPDAAKSVTQGMAAGNNDTSTRLDTKGTDAESVLQYDVHVSVAAAGRGLKNKGVAAELDTGVVAAESIPEPAVLSAPVQNSFDVHVLRAGDTYTVQNTQGQTVCEHQQAVELDADNQVEQADGYAKGMNKFDGASDLGTGDSNGGAQGQNFADSLRQNTNCTVANFDTKVEPSTRSWADLAEEEQVQHIARSAKEEENEVQSRIISQFSPAEVKELVENDIDIICATPNKVQPVFNTSPIFPNKYVRDKEGSPVPCSEVIEKSYRIFTVRHLVDRYKNQNGPNVLKNKDTYAKLMGMYNEQLLLTIEEHQQNVSPKHYTIEKTTPLSQEGISNGSEIDEQEWTPAKRKGRSRNITK